MFLPELRTCFYLEWDASDPVKRLETTYLENTLEMHSLQTRMANALERPLESLLINYMTCKSLQKLVSERFG